MVVVIGIDIAAQGPRTSICTLTWNAGWAAAEFGVGTDSAVLTALRTADYVGVDCPFGWPDSFVRAVTAHRTERWPDTDDAVGGDSLFRRTELAIQRDWGVRPQPVTGSLMGQVAVRWARLLGAHERAVHASCARDGSGPIVEVYPGIAARRWDLHAGSYKGTYAHQVQARECMTRMILGRSRLRPHIGNDMEASVADLVSDTRADRLDALLAALVATCAAERSVEPVPLHEAPYARTEGWIQIPTTDLESVGVSLGR